MWAVVAHEFDAEPSEKEGVVVEAGQGWYSILVPVAVAVSVVMSLS